MPKFYDIQPGGGSGSTELAEVHHLCENGVPIARFDDLEKAAAVRARYVAEIAEIHDRNQKIYDTN